MRVIILIKATADPLIIVGLRMQYYQVMQCRVSLVIFCKANKMFCSVKRNLNKFIESSHLFH